MSRREFTAQLENEQIAVTVVKSGDKLHEALEAHRFDMVVLEDGFAGVDVHEVRRLLAAQAGIGPLPLLIYHGGGKDSGKFSWHSDDTVTVHEATHGVPAIIRSQRSSIGSTRPL